MRVEWKLIYLGSVIVYTRDSLYLKTKGVVFAAIESTVEVGFFVFFFKPVEFLKIYKFPDLFLYSILNFFDYYGLANM